MDINLHIANLNIYGLDKSDKEILQQIFKQNQTIIMTTQEAVDKLNGVATQLAKVRTEVQTLVDAAANSGNVSPELQAAIDSVSAAVQGVDDLNPDATV